MRNKEIQDTINILPDDYVANKQDIAYFKSYDGCDDYVIYEHLIERIWSYVKSHYYNLDSIGDRVLGGAVSILSVNSGSGKVLEQAPKNTIITAYNNDYTCKRITDFVCQDRALEGKYFSEFKDISQFFALENTNSSRKYDIVVTQPTEDFKFYEDIDKDEELTKGTPIEYYTHRSLHFVEQNGLLIVICPKEKVSEVSNGSYFPIKTIIEIENKMVTSYVAVIIQKGN